jgi:hypothetical protein
MRCVLVLQRTCVTGMADGIGAMSGKPAATLLHCGPGLANGLSNLHNARRARSGIVNCVVDQATYHRPLDAQLTADTEGFSRAASPRFTRTVQRATRFRSAAMPRWRCRRRAPPGPDRDADPALRRVLGRGADGPSAGLPVRPRRRRTRWRCARPRARCASGPTCSSCSAAWR